MRTCGILMPIFSLSGKYGIGSFGKKAYEFVDFLNKGGQSYWQILPLSPTNYGDSPYQSFSSFAGNPYFIDIEKLIEEGLLSEEEADSFDFGSKDDEIDYAKLYKNRYPLLKLAFERFIPDNEYDTFVRENAFWLDDYALFYAIKARNPEKAVGEWEEGLKKRNPEKIAAASKENFEEIAFCKFLQFMFFRQWFALKTYANEKGIKIIGDIPIYTALDSADLWAEPEQFLVDAELKPSLVAGCPPDAFSDDGQLWGNPLYNWQYMKKDGYKWWKKRLSFALKIYDVVRIDHFRAFESYYAIPADEETAKNGKWVKGPDMDLFEEIKKEFSGDLPIIAEDLGFLTPAVHKLLAESEFPGMKVLQFAFDTREESDYLPHNYTKNCVVYTGTHDNDTINGWTKTAAAEDVELARRYLHVDDNEGFNWAMMRAAMASVADTCILMMADLLGLGSEGRINTPSTLGQNWQWRIKDGCVNDWLANILRENTELYYRLPTEE
ncbi:MAG: 4-alpha-glucanotransferase [Clostridia bacterium]|nr:4-alpha-glucanotransferase [Clostridia bacterium]